MKPTMFDQARRLPLAAAALAVMLAAAGCGGRATNPTVSAPTAIVPPVATTPAARAPADGPPAPALTLPSSTTSTQTAPRPASGLHFVTPQAAMRYLAAAYNRNDTPALKKVTNASARAALIAMRQEATNLQLTSCSRRAAGDYTCEFRHGYPEGLHRSGRGHATFLAAPADKPSWYMTVLIDCG